MPEIKLTRLDSPHIEVDQSRVNLQNRKEMALLAYLALTGKTCRRELLVSLLWPDYDASRGRANLRQVVFGLNRVLPDGWLTSDRESIGISPVAGLWIDVVEFNSLLAKCTEHGHPAIETCADCQPLLTRAVELYREDFMSGFSLADSADFDDWQLFQAETLRLDLGGALEKLAQCLTQKGEFNRALQQTRRWLSLDRLNETAHCALMRLYAWTGQRNAALHQYQECVDILHKQLGVGPQESTTDLCLAIEHDRAPKPPFSSEWQTSVLPNERGKEPGVHDPKKVDLSEALFSAVIIGQAEETLFNSGAEHANNLPLQLTSFIGREKEIAAIGQLLDAAPARLVTLTGMGGTGKTRLVLRMGEELLPNYPHGVWLVELAALDDPAMAPQAVARVLGVREIPGRSLTELLRDFLRHKRLLLILDNCEHLVAVCASLVKTLLQNSPGLHVLVTSRERLGVEGETVFNVPPLETPEEHKISSLQDLAQYEAVTLFIERAQASSPVFRFNETNAEAVTAICQRLEGIPLAIELATARLRLLSVDQVLVRLNDAFRILADGNRTALPRHQALRASIDWSFNLLNQDERQLIAELSGFTGSWTLEAAEAVGSGANILDRLSSLVDKSLVQVNQEPGKEPRFRMLETIRQYAQVKLVDNGTTSQVRTRHLAYYLELAERMEPELRGPKQIECLDRLEKDVDNLRAALSFAATEDKPSGLRLAAAMLWFWAIHNHHNEGVQWLEKLLDVGVYGHAGEAPKDNLQDMQAVGWVRASTALVLLSYLFSGSLTWLQRRALMEACVAVCRDLGSTAYRELARALMVLGNFTQLPRYEQRNQCLVESLAICKMIGDTFFTSSCLFFLSNNAFRQGKYQDWGDYLEESLAICRQIEDPDGLATRMVFLGKWFRFRGEYQRGVDVAEKGMAYYLEAGDRDGYYSAMMEKSFNLVEMEKDPALCQQVEEQSGFYFEIGLLDQWGGLLCGFTELAWSLGDFNLASRLGQEAFTLRRQGESSYNYPIASTLLARLALTRGDAIAARQHFIQGFNRTDEPDLPFLDLLGYLQAMVLLLLAEGKTRSAVRVMAAIDDSYQRWKAFDMPRARREYADALKSARQKLGEKDFALAWKEGETLTLEQAVEEIQF